MKIKQIILGVGLGVSILGGCNDDLGVVGPSIQPPGDRVDVMNDTFKIQASTVLMDAVYAKTDTALLGEIYDPLYGNLKSDYLCQFYCPDNFRFANTPIDGKIDSMDFVILYQNSIGDTLVPMRAQIYQLTEPLKKDYYTNVNPEEFTNMKISLGAKTYTAYDQSLSDSVRTEQWPHVRIRMPKEVGQKLYDETINNPETFNTQDSFNRFFPGLYVTTTYGTGNVLNVKSSQMIIYYKCVGPTGKDSLVSETFKVTKEVIQLSRFKNTDMNQLLQPNEDYTYIKSPAGVCTRLVFPMKEIIPKVKGRYLNNFPLLLKAYPQEDWKYAFQPAPNLLLIPEDSVKTFFENGQVDNNYSTFVSATYSATTQQYVFGNISKLIQFQMDTNPEEDLAVLIIPVKYISTTNPYTGQSTTTVLGNYMTPSGVKLRKDEESRTVVVTSSVYGQ